MHGFRIPDPTNGQSLVGLDFLGKHTTQFLENNQHPSRGGFVSESPDWFGLEGTMITLHFRADLMKDSSRIHPWKFIFGTYIKTLIWKGTSHLPNPPIFRFKKSIFQKVYVRRWIFAEIVSQVLHPRFFRWKLMMWNCNRPQGWRNVGGFNQPIFFKTYALLIWIISPRYYWLNIQNKIFETILT